MIRVITFLGELRDGAKPAAYQYGDHTYQGIVFPAALRQFIHYDEMNVFVTHVARQTAWPHLAALNDHRIKPVQIPDGRTPEDRWLIFDQLLSVVKDGDTLIFDITHGYRTLFFFVFLAIAYLKSARQNVTVQRVLYGEWSQGHTPGPVIDLTEYISLLDWMSATDQFINFGNSQALVRHIKQAAKSPHGDLEDSRKLMLFAASLDHVSRALQLVIPHQAMTASHHLQYTLDQARHPLQRRLRPFLPLLDRVDTAFDPLAFPDQHNHNDKWPALARQREIVYWYLGRQLLLQAITLAFEWLISYGIASLQFKRLDHGPTRERVRRYYVALNKMRNGDSLKLEEQKLLPEAEKKMETLPNRDHLLDVFEQAAHLRNNLVHASMTVHSNKTPADWEKGIRQVCRQLDTFPLPGLTQ